MSGYIFCVIIGAMVAVLGTLALATTPPSQRPKVFSTSCRILCVLGLGTVALCSVAPKQIPLITQDLVRLAEALGGGRSS
ncbi:hypothetical protein [Streptomyces murinus]|uniref:hypothetical protein n=1 Tax=Streptomyces murinus TaxID=33900 RepID=UPI003808954B